MEKYILALDQGTTTSRAILFNHDGGVVGVAQLEFDQIYPQSGWVEHDPEQIFKTVLQVIDNVLDNNNVNIFQVQAIGITNQRETTVVWNKFTGKPVYNAIVWQCRRTAEFCKQLREQGLQDLIHQKTGLVVDPYFSATKIKWILDNVPGARQAAQKGHLCFGNIDTYLMWKLSKGKIFATDYTNASRTMLFNIHTLQWDKQLLKIFDIPESMLPEVHPSSYHFGEISANYFDVEVPICGVAGDQQAALFGQLCTQKGQVKNTYGTGCFLLMNTGNVPVESKNGLITTLAASTHGVQYALEGSVFIGGAVVQWLRDQLGIIRSASETNEIAQSVPNTAGVYFVPAFVGLGAPYWDSEARGVLCGISRGTTSAHIVRASLESIAYQVNDILQAMQNDMGGTITRVAVDGGASANNFLMQFQADISGVEIIRPLEVETTAQGAAYLAGLSIGYWSSEEEIASLRKIERQFSVQMGKEKRNMLLDGWNKAICRTRNN